MSAWDHFANHARVQTERIPQEGLVLSFDELCEFVKGMNASELKQLIDSGDLTAAQVGEAQAANKAARAKANPS
jgi:hypothetical protein